MEQEHSVLVAPKVMQLCHPFHHFQHTQRRGKHNNNAKYSEKRYIRRGGY